MGLLRRAGRCIESASAANAEPVEPHLAAALARLARAEQLKIATGDAGRLRGLGGVALMAVEHRLYVAALEVVDHELARSRERQAELDHPSDDIVGRWHRGRAAAGSPIAQSTAAVASFSIDSAWARSPSARRRATALWSSRMLPGQSWFSSRTKKSYGRGPSPPSFSQKWRAKSAMSPRRCRSGGSSMRATARR